MRLSCMAQLIIRWLSYNLNWANLVQAENLTKPLCMSLRMPCVLRGWLLEFNTWRNKTFSNIPYIANYLRWKFCSFHGLSSNHEIFQWHSTSNIWMRCMKRRVVWLCKARSSTDQLCVCYHGDISNYIAPPHLATPSRPAQSQHYAVSMIHPAQPGSSRQFGGHPSPAQVSAMMMSLIVSCDLFPLAIIQAVPSAAADNGNWTIENAKGRLFLFLQQTRQPRDMNISPAGPDNNR